MLNLKLSKLDDLLPCELWSLPAKMTIGSCLQIPGLVEVQIAGHQACKALSQVSLYKILRGKFQKACAAMLKCAFTQAQQILQWEPSKKLTFSVMLHATC